MLKFIIVLCLIIYPYVPVAVLAENQNEEQEDASFTEPASLKPSSPEPVSAKSAPTKPSKEDIDKAAKEAAKQEAAKQDEEYILKASVDAQRAEREAWQAGAGRTTSDAIQASGYAQKAREAATPQEAQNYANRARSAAARARAAAIANPK